MMLLNVAAYASLAGGLIVMWRQRPNQPVSVDETFKLLEPTMRRAFPDLPEGFTWREGFARAREAGLEIYWDPVEKALRDYEAYRYGGAEAANPTPPDMVGLIKELHKLW